MRIALAQLNVTVGDVDGNVERLLDAWRRAADDDVDLVVATELAICGYPPEDLLLRPGFLDALDDGLQRLRIEGPQGCTLVVGTAWLDEGAADDDGVVEGMPQPGAATTAMGPERTAAQEQGVGLLRNAGVVLRDGEVVAVHRKWRLPNFGVFDEARYFSPGDEPTVVDVRTAHGPVTVGITVCEDIWAPAGALAAAADAGAQVVANLNASPYHRGKRPEREAWVRHHATTSDVVVAYANQVGGQDELVFDGDSMLLGADGTVLARGAQMVEDLVVVDLGRELAGEPLPSVDRRLDDLEEVWQALVLGVRDYCHKNGFTEAVIALSGGIDSALTAAIAADALGADNVLGVAMPSPHSSEGSLVDARDLATNLGLRYEVVPIAPAMRAFDGMLAELFDGLDADVTEENLQSRIRGTLIMALSNKFGSIVLTTGNKSEMAVGYATLYGDMNGGFNALKDVPKQLVFALSKHRNQRGPGIPENTISKPPSAELAPGQLDSDSLPPYDVLDPILAAYVEEDLPPAAIVERGLPAEAVARVTRMVDLAEYKRRQAPPGVKITRRAFGRDRRVPITSAWRPAPAPDPG